jgi:EAL domain-containing protein (putative c-di-GMP-specific phosphodiesterase class I)
VELILRSSNSLDGQDEYAIIDKNPYRVGRRSSNDYQILHPEVSGHHSEFRFDEQTWWVEDLQSTNGTFVNGIRISKPTRVKSDDIVHFGTKSFRVVSSIRRHKTFDPTQYAPETTLKARAAVAFFHILHDGLAYPCFQPVYQLSARRPVGWEALGRAATAEPLPPGLLFELAEQTELAIALSRTFRTASYGCLTCRHCWHVENRPFLFMNLHPSEIMTPRFGQYLEEMKWGDLGRHFRQVLEFPESLVCNSREMKVWMREVRRQDMLVAYDDFGKGQSRISDLVNAPPDFLKLDRELIAGLGSNGVKGDLIRGIVDACTRLKVRIIAEGIEKESELRACSALGIQFGQGRYLMPPLPAWELFGAETGALPGSCPFVRLELLRPSGVDTGSYPSQPVEAAPGL